jgi:hypothetical protein
MSEPSGKLNLEEAAGRRTGAAPVAGKPTLRIRKSDIKAMQKRPLSKKKKLAFGLVALLVAAALGNVLWYTQEWWLPFWRDALPSSGGDAAPAARPVAGGTEAAAAGEEAADAADDAATAAMAVSGPLPPPETLTYFSAAGWGDESFRQAVRHFNAGFDAYRAFLADDTSSRPLAQAESETIAALKLLQDLLPSVPGSMKEEVAYDVLQARSLLAEVRRLARDPGATAAAAAQARAAGAQTASGGEAGVTPKTWKNPDYLEAARAYNRAVAKYKEFLADKSGKQALLKEIENDAFAAAKKFESLKPSAPAGIPLQDHITQCYKLISDCRRQQLESPVQPSGPSSRAHPARQAGR